MKTLARLAVSDEGFIFDPVNGDSFLTNPAGVFILRKLRDGALEGAIAEALESEFEVAGPDASRDVSDFLSQLKSLGLS